MLNWHFKHAVYYSNIVYLSVIICDIYVILTEE